MAMNEHGTHKALGGLGEYPQEILTLAIGNSGKEKKIET